MDIVKKKVYTIFMNTRLCQQSNSQKKAWFILLLSDMTAVICVFYF